MYFSYFQLRVTLFTNWYGNVFMASSIQPSGTCNFVQVVNFSPKPFRSQPFNISIQVNKNLTYSLKLSYLKEVLLNPLEYLVVPQSLLLESNRAAYSHSDSPRAPKGLRYTLDFLWVPQGHPLALLCPPGPKESPESPQSESEFPWVPWVSRVSWSPKKSHKAHWNSPKIQ